MRNAILIVAGILLVFGVSAMVKHSSSGIAPVADTAAGKGDGAEVVPSAAFATTTLHARRTDTRAAHASVESCRWFKNGDEIGGVEGDVLTPDHFARGDEIVAEVRLDAGSEPVRTRPVVIQNTPPQVVNASTVLRREPTAALAVAMTVVDADGDSVSRAYTWLRNGQEVPGQTGPTVDASLFKKGDTASARVSVSDGSGWSAPVLADPVEFGSNAPKITSSPPVDLEEGGRFVYQVKTSAPDPNALKYELVEGPEGMTVDRRGRVEWSVPPDTTGIEYGIAIRVSDPTGGESTQRFRIAAVPPGRE
jgi:hypothetical protein